MSFIHRILLKKSLHTDASDLAFEEFIVNKNKINLQNIK